MAWWMVEAQTGFGARDARGIVDILKAAPKQDGEASKAAIGTVT
jgi:hypothetical protein